MRALATRPATEAGGSAHGGGGEQISSRRTWLRAWVRVVYVRYAYTRTQNHLLVTRFRSYPSFSQPAHVKSLCSSEIPKLSNFFATFLGLIPNTPFGLRPPQSSAFRCRLRKWWPPRCDAPKCLILLQGSATGERQHPSSPAAAST